MLFSGLERQCASISLARLILQNDVQSVDDAGNVTYGGSISKRFGGWSVYSLLTKNGQEDVDEEVCAAAALKENTERRDEDGEDDLDDVAAGLVSLSFPSPSARTRRGKRCWRRLTSR